MIRLLLCDDEVLVRTGMRMILEANTTLEIVGEAADGAEAVDLVIRHQPDVALMDIRMPVVDGIRRPAGSSPMRRVRPECWC